jgi:hypothetical protein
VTCPAYLIRQSNFIIFFRINYRVRTDKHTDLIKVVFRPIAYSVPSEVKFGIISLCIAISSYQLGKPRRRLEDKMVTDIMGFFFTFL